MTKPMSDSYSSTSDSESPSPAKEPRSLAEWVSTGISAAIISVVIGLVIYLWVSPRNQNPPELSVATQSQDIREAAGLYYVPFEVTNNGGETVESVQVIAELRINGEVVESGEQQIDFLSSEEMQDGAFIFSRNPREGTLTIRAASYKLN